MDKLLEICFFYVYIGVDSRLLKVNVFVVFVRKSWVNCKKYFIKGIKEAWK